VIIRFQKNWSSASWDVYAFERDPRGGRISYRITLEALAPVNEGTFLQPAIQLPLDHQQPFVDALLEGLSEAGIIPRMGATEAELVATKRHLEDMRALTFEEIKPIVSAEGDCKDD